MRATALRRMQKRISHARCITSVSGDCATLHDGFHAKLRNCRSAETPRLTGLPHAFLNHSQATLFSMAKSKCSEHRCIRTKSMIGIAKPLLVHRRTE
ncbi:hypothetical protein GGP41_007668 [Bipolaris sorokiniana]|uniref:Uncharacterized protein n=1 Tax=Cochliobolus sativus TaxID=45130 RepID=A0A8H5Z8D5_COCSA|nr:hypothetical protein GGP41_007668 [Bipolaris sorokiniana]